MPARAGAFSTCSMGGFLAKPQLKPHRPFAPGFQRLQVRDMRHKLGRRARHDQPVFRKDFVALAKDA